ncbi:hypothetical protein M501DRAFT_993106 [Patellaria atrata CBS 101060]|uniref:Uncharacterized protein n=1 Tax=Patellaria atrata CBS 101060 TaxID=1346257 RepID=A0A9P4VP01_9PEZI|nr:hypothetical protein M501DRAFT_993106 [Patellaria atrata CBS 101060]
MIATDFVLPFLDPVSELFPELDLGVAAAFWLQLQKEGLTINSVKPRSLLHTRLASTSFSYLNDDHKVGPIRNVTGFHSQIIQSSMINRKRRVSNERDTSPKPRRYPCRWNHDDSEIWPMSSASIDLPYLLLLGVRCPKLQEAQRRLASPMQP